MQPNQQEPPERLYTPAEVARIFRVDTKTVARWGDTGRLACIRTPGNQRRWRESVVRAALGEDEPLSPLPLSHPVWRNPRVTTDEL